MYLIFYFKYGDIIYQDYTMAIFLLPSLVLNQIKFIVLSLRKAIYLAWVWQYKTVQWLVWLSFVIKFIVLSLKSEVKHMWNNSSGLVLVNVKLYKEVLWLICELRYY